MLAGTCRAWLGRDAVSAPKITWGQVVESDEIYFAKTRRWYEVTQTVLSQDGKTVRIWVKGQIKAAVRAVGDVPDDYRRGATGAVVDLFQVVFSGQYTPGKPGDNSAKKSESEDEE